MRQKGNLRLLLNANLWGEMQVSRMEGGKVRPCRGQRGREGRTRALRRSTAAELLSG